MSNSLTPTSRRQKDSGKLDIDRRRSTGRRDDDRRLWLDNAYETIYIPTYVNRFHTCFEPKIHAFSNLFEEPAEAEWVAHELAQMDARLSRAPRTIKDFALEMIRRGLVVDENGVEFTTEIENQMPDMMHLLLKTGT